MFNGLNSCCYNFEKKILNPLGYVPLVGSLTGPFRAGAYASLQTTAGLVGVAVFTVLGSASSVVLQTKPAYRAFSYAGESLRYVGHGILNAIRGAIETIPFLPWLLCTPYDVAGGEIMAYNIKPISNNPKELPQYLVLATV